MIAMDDACRIGLGLLLLSLFFGNCSHEALPGDKTTGTQPTGAWWKQDTAVTWSGLQDPAHDQWLGFVKEVGTTICDRGIFYNDSTPPRSRARVAEYYHQRGLHVTSFLSIDKWKTDEQSLTRLIQLMRQQLDDGCDGIHLDMLFSVDEPKNSIGGTDAAVRAVVRMRDAVHDYPRQPQAIFAGNTWMLDTPFSLSVAKLCDIAWIESWGHSDLDLIRIARVARSLDGYSKPTWYHWQPHDNEQVRVQRLGNLPKALYSSCMLEGAVFLCNYRYPVPLVHRDEANRQVTQWQMFDINTRWQQSVLQYARFVKEHGDLLREAQPVAPVLVAFRPAQVSLANRIMRDLLVADVAFNVVVCGTWPLAQLEAKDLAGYQAVVTPDVPWVQRAGGARVYDSATTLLATAEPEVRDFCRVQGQSKVATRAFLKGPQMLVHLKQHGYTDQADGVAVIGPLALTLRCPRSIRTVTCFSPDRPGSAKLTFSQQGSQTTITVPLLEYYNLLVLDLKN